MALRGFVRRRAAASALWFADGVLRGGLALYRRGIVPRSVLQTALLTAGTLERSAVIWICDGYSFDQSHQHQSTS